MTVPFFALFFVSHSSDPILVYQPFIDMVFFLGGCHALIGKEVVF